jgi:hypothetical protein
MLGVEHVTLFRTRRERYRTLCHRMLFNFPIGLKVTILFYFSKSQVQPIQLYLNPLLFRGQPVVQC